MISRAQFHSLGGRSVPPGDATEGLIPQVWESVAQMLPAIQKNIHSWSEKNLMHSNLMTISAALFYRIEIPSYTSDTMNSA